MGAPGGAGQRAKRERWTWRDWYEAFISQGSFPDEFVGGLQGVLLVLRRSLPDSVYGPWTQDRRQELFCGVITALTNSRRLTEYYKSGWDDKQLFGYVRKVMENEIHAMRRRDHPAWFWMLERINQVAVNRLALIDDRKRMYIPAEWLNDPVASEPQDAQILEERINAVPPFGQAGLERIPTAIVDKAVTALFDAAGCPIPLKKLISHSLRLLCIDDLNTETALAMHTEEGQEIEREFVDNDRHDPTIEIEIQSWLGAVVTQLTVEHLVVLWTVVCDKDGGTFELAASRVNLLLQRQMSAETARNRFHEAAKLMRPSLSSPKYPSGFIPGLESERDFFAKALSRLIENRLHRIGIEFETPSEG